MRFSTVNNEKVLLNYQSISDSVSEFVRKLIETMINEEFEIFINRLPYQRKSQAVKLRRNGYRYRYWLFIWSKLIRLKVPRCREASVIPKINLGRSLTDVELGKMIIQIWSEGCSYRDLQTLVKRIYGERLSTRTFGKIVRGVDKYVKQYHSRPITYFYDAIYIDGLSVSIKGLPREYLYEYLRKKKKNAA